MPANQTPTVQYQELADPIMELTPATGQTWHALYPSVIRYVDVMVPDGSKPGVNVQV
jgi:hypothetical protein